MWPLPGKGHWRDRHHLVIWSSGASELKLILVSVGAAMSRQAERSVRVIARRPAATRETANSRWHSSMVAKHSGRAARKELKRAAGIMRAAAPRLHSFSSSALGVAVRRTSLKKVWMISCAVEKFCRPSGWQLDRQPGDQHAIGLIGLVRRIVLLLPGDMGHQRLNAHQRQAPLGAQPLHLHPPRPGRLARHSHRREPLRSRLRHRPVQRLAQPERLHLHRLTRQHPHIVIDHRDRLLVFGQVDTDHHTITRQQPAKPIPPRIPLPVSPRHAVAATLAHRTSSSLRLGHQARTTAPGGRSCLNRVCGFNGVSGPDR